MNTTPRTWFFIIQGHCLKILGDNRSWLFKLHYFCYHCALDTEFFIKETERDPRVKELPLAANLLFIVNKDDHVGSCLYDTTNSLCDDHKSLGERGRCRLLHLRGEVHISDGYRPTLWSNDNPRGLPLPNASCAALSHRREHSPRLRVEYT